MFLDQLQQADALGTTSFNRLARWRFVKRFFAVISRLGDGVVWYAIMLTMPWIGGGWDGLALMALTGLVGTALYRRLKAGLRRPRPCQVHRTLTLCIAPLDRYSFPSGHTLHAVAFTLLATALVPGLGQVLIPFTLLVAISRLVLGLHYPSDVLVGGGLGAALAFTAQAVAIPFGILP